MCHKSRDNSLNSWMLNGILPIWNLFIPASNDSPLHCNSNCKNVLWKAKGFVIPALSQLLENNDGQNDHPGRAYSLLPYERSIMREMEVSPKSHFWVNPWYFSEILQKSGLQIIWTTFQFTFYWTYWLEIKYAGFILFFHDFSRKWLNLTVHLHEFLSALSNDFSVRCFQLLFQLGLGELSLGFWARRILVIHEKWCILVHQCWLLSFLLLVSWIFVQYLILIRSINRIYHSIMSNAITNGTFQLERLIFWPNLTGENSTTTIGCDTGSNGE